MAAHPSTELVLLVDTVRNPLRSVDRGEIQWLRLLTMELELQRQLWIHCCGSQSMAMADRSEQQYFKGQGGNPGPRSVFEVTGLFHHHVLREYWFLEK